MNRFPLIVIVLVLAACAEEAPPGELLRPVRTETVFATGADRVRTFSGVTRAGQETQLSFRVAGTIERVYVDVGDGVRAGDVIGRLDSSDYEIAVRQAEAKLAQANASLLNAESELDRTRGLWENQNASQGQLDAANAAAQSARAQVDGANQSLQASRRQLSYTELRAPTSGSIASVMVEANENVSPGQTIVLLTSGGQPEVELAIPEGLIAQIREGDSVEVTVEAAGGASLEGAVTEVGVAATGTATTFPVTVRLSRTPDDIRSGMAADVTFTFRAEDASERIYLPSHAVGGDREGRFVFLLETTGEPGVGVVRRTPVEVGGFVEDRLAILSGVDDGQLVVTAGVRLLADGQRVRVLPGQESAR